MLNKKIRLYFILALVFAIGFPCGVLLIIFNNAFKIPSAVVLTFGIILCVLGFYVMPMMWINYANLKKKRAICNQIQLDNVQEIAYLAKINNMGEEQMLNELRGLIADRYLAGYSIVDDKFITPSTNEKLTQEQAEALSRNTKTISCSGCGAPVEIVDGKKGNCPYCGRPLK